ncbi:MerR family transcriptional regulator [Fundicoccus sp. Sow4_H7]|uniref:MerR family transcriptional regulator n=1 Tax=Fundicoccus sp. Sow4_H7 TaxID=3438784 RepID=UPI003F93CB34
MKMSEVSQLTGISKDTLHYYDKIGLLQPQRNGSHRDYQDTDLETIELIQILKDATFSLDEIRLLLDLDKQYLTMESILQMETNDIEDIKDLLAIKLDQIEQKMNRLLTAQQLIKGMHEKMDQLSKRSHQNESNT